MHRLFVVDTRQETRFAHKTTTPDKEEEVFSIPPLLFKSKALYLVYPSFILLHIVQENIISSPTEEVCFVLEGINSLFLL